MSAVTPPGDSAGDSPACDFVIPGDPRSGGGPSAPREPGGSQQTICTCRCDECYANEGDYFGEIMEMMRTDIIGEQGCHLTWPELRHLTRQELELSWTVIRDREVDFTELPSYYCAIVNLQGFVRYRMEDEAAAEDTFRELLEVDAANICALGNLAVICYRDSRFTEHEEYLDRLKTIISRRDPLNRARCYYDRAHTIRHFEQDKRKFTYVSFIEKAVEISKGVLERERSEWQFDYGLALYRRDTQLTMGRASTALLESGFREASEQFHAVITNNGPLGYRALSWTFLGILLMNQPGRKFEESLPAIDDLHGLCAVECFNKALSIAPSHPIVLRRIGSEMTNLGDFHRAKTLLDASLRIEESWFAYRHRGLLNLAMYEHGVRGEAGDETASRSEYLGAAQKDFKEALKWKKVHADYSDLGYVMYLLGERRSAVQQYSCAVKCPRDDYFNPAVTHRRWARCLRDMKEVKGANFQEAKAEEVEEALRKDAKTIPDRFIGHGLGCRGFECDLERFNYSSEDRRGFVNILSEDRNPVSMGSPLPFLSKHHTDYKYDFFISFSHIDHKWTLLFFRKLERELGVRGCIRYRDYECGNAIATNILGSIRKSAKVLVVVSPDSLQDQWCRYEVQRAHMEDLKRDYPCVIPIMLRLCRIPEEFEAMTYLKCQDGQFTVDDWYRLGKSLQKRPGPR